MIPRVVYDTMLFFQAAAQEPPRLHGTFRLLESGTARLCLSAELFDEVWDVLSRPEMQEKAPALTPERVAQFLAKARSVAVWIDDVPKAYTLPEHPDDDHLLNLAIAADANFLVTWEKRILELDRLDCADGQRLRRLAPQLRILTPSAIARELQAS